jgi:hypothetical protein
MNDRLRQLRDLSPCPPSKSGQGIQSPVISNPSGACIGCDKYLSHRLKALFTGLAGLSFRLRVGILSKSQSDSASTRFSVRLWLQSRVPCGTLKKLQFKQ